MGGSHSITCKEPLQNPDMLNVVTLSDSAVQRLPLITNDSPLDKEQRKQNIDDYWRDRLECIDQTYSEARGVTEKEFARLEYNVKSMSPQVGGKAACPRMIEEAGTCYVENPTETLNCSTIIRKFELCLDTIIAEGARKQYLDELKRVSKRVCAQK